MGHLNIFDGGAFGSIVEDNVFATESDIFSEGVADPVIGEEESFALNRLVSGKNDSIEVLDFAFGVFGPEKNVHEGRDGFAIIDGSFDKEAFVEVEAEKVIDDFKSAFGVAGVSPSLVIDSEAFDEVVVLCRGVVFEGFDDCGEVGGLDTNILVAAIFKLLEDELAELFVEEFEVGSGDFGAHLLGLDGLRRFGGRIDGNRLRVDQFFRCKGG